MRLRVRPNKSLASGDHAAPGRPVLAGLVSGSAAAVVASLVSLPLRSPDDILFNSATVTVGALFAGLAAGALWRVLSGRNRYTAFGVLWSVGFGLVAAAAFLAQTQLDRVVPYALPLAAIAFPVIGVGTLAGGRASVLKPWVAAVAIAVALGVGIGLSGIGDEESGELKLPPRASNSIPPDPAVSAYAATSKVPSA